MPHKQSAVSSQKMHFTKQNFNLSTLTITLQDEDQKSSTLELVTKPPFLSMIEPSNQSIFPFWTGPKNPVWNDPKNPVTNSCQDKKGDLINLDRRLGTLLIQFKLPTKMSTLIILCAR